MYIKYIFFNITYYFEILRLKKVYLPTHLKKDIFIQFTYIFLTEYPSIIIWKLSYQTV